VSHPLSNINAEEQADVFIIQNADGMNTISMAGSSALISLMQNVEERFVLQYANLKNIVPINAPPAELMTLLQSAEDRFVLQYANGKFIFPLSAPPAGLTSLLQAVADRFVLQYANASNTYSLYYPVEVVDDTTAPAIVQISTQTAGDNMVLTVETSEFTLARLDYGSASGAYTQEIEDDEFRYEHSFTLSGLTSGTTYYYQLTLTDRSGNTFQSPEYTLEKQEVFNIYLPISSR
jgi:hypothetical protein